MALTPNRSSMLLGLAPKKPALGGTAGLLAARAEMAKKQAELRADFKDVEMGETDAPQDVFGDSDEDAVTEVVEEPKSTGWKRPSFLPKPQASVTIEATANPVETPKVAPTYEAFKDEVDDFDPEAEDAGFTENPDDAEEVDDEVSWPDPEPARAAETESTIPWHVLEDEREDNSEVEASVDMVVANHPAGDERLMQVSVPRSFASAPAIENVTGAAEKLAVAKEYRAKIDELYYELALLCDEMVDENVPKILGYASDAAFFEAEFGWGYRKARYFISIAKTFRDSGIEKEDIRRLGWTKAKEAEGLTGDKLLALVDYANAGANAKDVASEARRLKGRPETISMKREVFTLFDDQSEMVNKAIDLVLPKLGTTNRSQALSAIVTEWSLSNGAAMDAKAFLRQGLNVYGAEAIIAALGEMDDGSEVSE